MSTIVLSNLKHQTATQQNQQETQTMKPQEETSVSTKYSVVSTANAKQTDRQNTEADEY